MSDLKSNRFPSYDVMAKRDTPSFNEKTRTVLDRRLAVTDEAGRFLSREEFATLKAMASRVIPQPVDRLQVPIAALIDERLEKNKQDGYRVGPMPPMRQAWRLGLDAIDLETRKLYERRFCELDGSTQDLVLKMMEKGELTDPAWAPMTAKHFFQQRVLHDIVMAYYAHPTAWNEMGFGGPASPRGYVRMGVNQRDPWEAAETRDGDTAHARKENSRVQR